MKKKVLSIILAIMMVLSVVPLAGMTAFAEEIVYPQAQSEKVIVEGLDYAVKYTYAQVGDDSFNDWYVDFTISADKPVPAEAITIAGQYYNKVDDVNYKAAYNNTFALEANEEYRVLANNPVKPVKLTYGALKAYTDDFTCGIKDNALEENTKFEINIILFKENQEGKEEKIEVTGGKVEKTLYLQPIAGYTDATVDGLDQAVTYFIETPGDDYYNDWEANIYITPDRDVAAGEVQLGGKYDAYEGGALVLLDSFAMKEGVPCNVIDKFKEAWGTTTGITYKTLAEKVQAFTCGVKNIALAENTNFSVNIELTKEGEAPIAVKGSDVVESFPAVEFEAAIGTTNYKTLAEAVAAAKDGDTVTLLKDTVVSAPVVFDVQDGEVTFDLGGYTLSAAEGFAPKNLGVVMIENGTKLEITNGTIDADDNVYSAVILTVDKSKTFANNGYAELVTDATIIGEYYGIVGNGSRPGTKITVNDGADIKGTATNDNYAIYNPQGNSSVIINGGTLTGDCAAIEMRGGNLEVKGGTLTALAETYSVKASGSGTTTTGAAVAVAQHNTKQDIDVKINGGTLSGLNAVSVADPQGNKTTNVTVTLGAAEYNGELAYSAKEATVTNAGSSLAAPAGYKWDATGKLVAVEYVAEIDGTKYETLEEAVAAAKDGDTVELLADVAVSKPVVFDVQDGNVTLDLGGYTLSAAEGFAPKNLGVVMIENGTKLEITNGTIDADDNVYSAVILTAPNSKTEEDGLAELTTDATLIGKYYGIVGNGSRPGTKITVNDGADIKGTEKGDNYAIFNPQGNSSVIINGGTLTGDCAAIEMRGGNLEVNGGTLTALAETYSVTDNGSGTTTTGAAVAVAQHTTKKDIDVKINGGTLSGLKAVSVADPQKNNTTNVAVTLGDAEYIGELAYSAEKATVTNAGSSLDAPAGYVWVNNVLVKDVKPAAIAEEVLGFEDCDTAINYKINPDVTASANYNDWNADIIIVANKDVAKGAVTLKGAYEGAGVASVSPAFTAENPVSLLGLIGNPEVTYADLIAISNAGGFTCGIKGKSLAEDTTFTIYIRLTKDGEEPIIVSGSEISKEVKETSILEEYTVTVEGGATVSQKLDPAKSKQYKIATVQIKETDDAIREDGKWFVYWVDEAGRIITTATKYSFFVVKDTTLTPVYVDKAEYAEARAKAVGATNIVRAEGNGNDTVTLFAEHAISKVALVSVRRHGIIYTTDASEIGLLTIDGADSIKNGAIVTASKTLNSTSGLFKATVSADGNDTVYAVSYLIDKEGNEYYSDVVTVSANGIVGGTDALSLETVELALEQAEEKLPAAEEEIKEAAPTIIELFMSLVKSIIDVFQSIIALF